MAIVLQLNPDLERTLAAEARSRGLSLEQYVQSLLQQQLPSPAPRRKPTMKEFEAALDCVAAHSEKVPELPDEALGREGIYGDHD